MENAEQKPLDNSYPLESDHPCFKEGHAMYKVAEINNGYSIYGEHKCSRCGYVEPFQFDHYFPH